jgi:hypothetical protein
MPLPLEERITGYEPKLLRVVIENWLYHPDVKERIRAATEVRKRLQKAFPVPDWLKEKPNANL